MNLEAVVADHRESAWARGQLEPGNSLDAEVVQSVRGLLQTRNDKTPGEEARGSAGLDNSISCLTTLLVHDGGNGRIRGQLQFGPFQAAFERPVWLDPPGPRALGSRGPCPVRAAG